MIISCIISNANGEKNIKILYNAIFDELIYRFIVI